MCVCVPVCSTGPRKGRRRRADRAAASRPRQPFRLPPRREVWGGGRGLQRAGESQELLAGGRTEDRSGNSESSLLPPFHRIRVRYPHHPNRHDLAEFIKMLETTYLPSFPVLGVSIRLQICVRRGNFDWKLLWALPRFTRNSLDPRSPHPTPLAVLRLVFSSACIGVVADHPRRRTPSSSCRNQVSTRDDQELNTCASRYEICCYS